MPQYETRMSESSNQFRVGNSPGYALFSLLLHGGAGLMLLLTFNVATFPMPEITLLALIWLALGIAAISDLRRSGVCRGPQSITRISISNRDRRWRFCRRSGQSFGPAVVTGGRVLGAALWLQLRDEPGQSAAICVPADAMSPRMYRRLRVAAREALGQ